MEQRRLWWLVAGGPSTVIWERGYLLAIPSTRENHCSILVVNCDKRRGCTVIGVIASLPSRCLYYTTEDLDDPEGNGSRKPTNGVKTSWCTDSLVCWRWISGGS